MRQPHLLQHGPQLVVGEAVLGQGITELLAQTAEQHVWLLRDEQQVPHRRRPHGADGRLPKAADHAQQGGLAAARGAHDEEALPAADGKTQVVHEQTRGAWRLHAHVPKDDAGAGRLNVLIRIAVFA